jgi:hypothetical protein
MPSEPRPGNFHHLRDTTEEDEVTGFVGPGAHVTGDLLDLRVW